jgi:hypothetical protein
MRQGRGSNFTGRQMGLCDIPGIHGRSKKEQCAPYRNNAPHDALSSIWLDDNGEKFPHYFFCVKYLFFGFFVL